uniref:Uncharacterized protein n=1 Tax=Amphimedon queenslandica TaxID=400682 RepID=A0A1X7U762_AMPQE
MTLLPTSTEESNLVNDKSFIKPSSYDDSQLVDEDNHEVLNIPVTKADICTQVKEPRKRNVKVQVTEKKKNATNQ